MPNAKQILEKTDFIYETIKEVDKNSRIITRHSVIGKLENGRVLKVAVKDMGDKLIFVTVYDPVVIKKDDEKTHKPKAHE